MLQSRLKVGCKYQTAILRCWWLDSKLATVKALNSKEKGFVSRKFQCQENSVLYSGSRCLNSTSLIYLSQLHVHYLLLLATPKRSLNSVTLSLFTPLEQHCYFQKYSIIFKRKIYIYKDYKKTTTKKKSRRNPVEIKGVYKSTMF